MINNILIASDQLSAEISPLGAELRRLTTRDGRELLWDGDPAFWTGRAPILFPVVGLLEGGVYRLDGKSYAMPKHGFARQSTFQVGQAAADRATFLLTASEATRAVYPFEFALEIEFAIEGAALSMTARVSNRGETEMPASFGFHPALRWPLPFGEPRESHRIRFAHDEPAPIRRVGDDGLVLPDAQPTPVIGDTMVLRDELFTNDAVIFDDLRSRSLRYGAERGPQLAVDFEALPALGVWTKPGAGYVCIEPWQGHADPSGFDGDIRDKPGIVMIAPGESRSFTMRIALESA